MISGIHNALTADETKAVLDVADKHLQAKVVWRRRKGILVWTALTTGLRLSELARLDWEDFDFERKTVEVWRHKKKGPNYQKGVAHSGGIRDVIVMTDELAVRLEPLSTTSSKRGKSLRATGPLFISERRRRACHHTLKRDWTIVVQEANVPRKGRGVHCARHTFASALGAQTGSPWVVRAALGHSDFATSQVYVEKNPLALRKTINDLYADPETATTDPTLLKEMKKITKLLAPAAKARRKGKSFSGAARADKDDLPQIGIPEVSTDTRTAIVARNGWIVGFGENGQLAADSILTAGPSQYQVVRVVEQVTTIYRLVPPD